MRKRCVCVCVCVCVYVSLGWNCARRTGEGKRRRRSISPLATSHNITFQSVEELRSLHPERFQLQQ